MIISCSGERLSKFLHDFYPITAAFYVPIYTDLSDTYFSDHMHYFETNYYPNIPRIIYWIKQFSYMMNEILMKIQITISTKWIKQPQTMTDLMKDMTRTAVAYSARTWTLCLQHYFKVMIDSLWRGDEFTKVKIKLRRLQDKTKYNTVSRTTTVAAISNKDK